MEGVEAVRVADDVERDDAWAAGKIAVLVDPQGASITRCKPDAFIDASLAQRNLGTSSANAALVVALGPGFTVGKDCHVVIETNRGHNLGRLIYDGVAEANTGIPATEKQIGDPVCKGEILGRVGTAEASAQIGGILRGLIRPGSTVRKGLKIGDVDLRGKQDTVTRFRRRPGHRAGLFLKQSWLSTIGDFHDQFVDAPFQHF